MKLLFTLLLSLSASLLSAQNLYFPPIGGNTWETISHNQLGWCPDSVAALIDFAGDNNTKALIVLKNGRIALEHYYDTFTADSLWYWASAGKSLTAFMVGLAQEQGFLSINDTSSRYLGQGWTVCTPEQEENITLRNQLCMTSGLDDGVANVDCTLDTCLQYLAEPGTRWAYHNAPYTLLDQVIENATGVSLNSFVLNNLSLSTGIFGAYLQVEYNNVFFSTARSMARFGLLCQNNGIWNQNAIMNDQEYFFDMVHSSQNLNNSYGYLWWLNGQESYMLPGLELVIPGPLMQDAPADVYAAIGKNVQCVMISPSTGYVIVRMGNPPEGVTGLVPTILPNMLWKKVLSLECEPTGFLASIDTEPGIFPNPGNGIYRIKNAQDVISLRIYDLHGKLIQTLQNSDTFELDADSGIYQVILDLKSGNTLHQRLIKL